MGYIHLLAPCEGTEDKSPLPSHCSLPPTYWAETTLQSWLTTSQQGAELAERQCRSPETHKHLRTHQGILQLPLPGPFQGPCPWRRGRAVTWCCWQPAWAYAAWHWRGNYGVLRRKGRKAREAAFNFPLLSLYFFPLVQAFHMVALLLPTRLTDCVHWRHPGQKATTWASHRLPNLSYSPLSQRSFYSVFFLSTMKMLK